ncbi:ribosome silencing factor [Akkermansiaceae bacterium]|jgi:ribosome-associated protein|nr:ribosome silencing factor [Akkermansiaceae bacterium]MDB4520081.1 ribosome silencing factor [Akkermansiaceae bacterium]|tara:strand:+ start:3523 stop:3897 length:375 start_codon:yes stop_codon:yes gene_type:complete
MSDSGEKLALACAHAADETKADDIRIFDVRGISTITDFMIVCSGASMPHLKAISRDIEKKVAEVTGEYAFRTEGKASTRWVVLDFVDVMVHVLHTEMRELYALEDLWGDAKQLIWCPEPEDDED